MFHFRQSVFLWRPGVGRCARRLRADGRVQSWAEYELRGQILAVDSVRGEITIKHEDIKGFMPGMTMPFKVRDGALLVGRTPGDLVRATLVVEDSTGYLTVD